MSANKLDVADQLAIQMWSQLNTPEDKNLLIYAIKEIQYK